MGIDRPTTPIESPIVVAGISDVFSRLCAAGVISAVIAVAVASFCSARDHEPRDQESTRDDQSIIEKLFPFHRMHSSVHNTIAVGSESKDLSGPNTFRPTGGTGRFVAGAFVTDPKSGENRGTGGKKRVCWRSATGVPSRGPMIVRTVCVALERCPGSDLPGSGRAEGGTNHESAVVTAEAERIRERRPRRPCTGFLLNDIDQRELGIIRLESICRRN